MTQEFPTDVVLSVTTGVMLSESRDVTVRDLLEYMTSEPISAHPIDYFAVVERCAINIIGQHPLLRFANVILADTFDGVQYPHLRETARDFDKLFGETLPIKPLPTNSLT